jgi:hypothetical protein
VDFIAELDKKFKDIVTNQLDARSREALLTQQDPSTMEDIGMVKIRKSILHRVYGNYLPILIMNQIRILMSLSL